MEGAFHSATRITSTILQARLPTCARGVTLAVKIARKLIPLTAPAASAQWTFSHPPGLMLSAPAKSVATVGGPSKILMIQPEGTAQGVTQVAPHATTQTPKPIAQAATQCPPPR